MIDTLAESLVVALDELATFPNRRRLEAWLDDRPLRDGLDLIDCPFCLGHSFQALGTAEHRGPVRYIHHRDDCPVRMWWRAKGIELVTHGRLSGPEIRAWVARDREQIRALRGAVVV